MNHPILDLSLYVMEKQTTFIALLLILLAIMIMIITIISTYQLNAFIWLIELATTSNLEYIT